MRHLPIALAVMTMLSASIPAEAESPRPSIVQEDVRYESSVPLAAALLLPDAPRPLPAAVIVQGSGESDRTNVWARKAAELFAERGIAVLLTDKRGSGKSGGDWRMASFDDLAADALAGVDYLKGRKEIDAARIGVVGLSQGGWIVPIVAAKRSEVAFVVDFSGATVSFAEQSMLEMTNTARKAGLPPDAVAEVVTLNKAAGRYLLGGPWSDYAAVRERALAGVAKPVARGFPDSASSPIWTFLKKVGAFDPLPYWTVVEQPVFIAFGERDEEDNVPVRESVRRLEWTFTTVGKRNYEIVVVPGAGHALWSAPETFAPLLVERLGTWLSANVLK